MTANGECYEFLCMNPATITVPTLLGKLDPQGEPTTFDRFSIGSMAGFNMAMDVAKAEGFDDFRSKDVVQIECVGLIPPTKLGHSPMVEFKLEIERN